MLRPIFLKRVSQVCQKNPTLLLVEERDEAHYPSRPTSVPQSFYVLFQGLTLFLLSEMSKIYAWPFLGYLSILVSELELVSY